MLAASRSEEEVFTIIGELKLVPASAGRILPILGVGKHVEGGEWFSVKVAEVI